MPRVSKRKLTNKELVTIETHLLRLLESLRNKIEVKSFLNEFLTQEEYVMLSKRLVIFMLLERKYEIPFIESSLHMSYETVRSYKNQLEHKSRSFKAMLQKLVSKQETEEFFKVLEQKLKPLLLALEVRKNTKSRAKFAQADFE